MVMCLPRQLLSQTAEALESGCELIRKMSGIFWMQATVLNQKISALCPSTRTTHHKYCCNYVSPSNNF
jgi:hypothetical protein